MNALLGNIQNNAFVGAGSFSFPCPASATGVYIATDTSALRVTTDGTTTPTDTVGLLVPPNSTAVFAVRASSVLQIRATGAANVSIQFLGSGR